MAEEQQPQGETPGDAGEMPDFDGWISTQNEQVRGLIESHTQSLKGALKAERESAKTMARQLKELSGKLDANSEAAQRIGEMQAAVETAQRQADFYEQATAAGCQNVRLAWLAAQADGADVATVKAQYPELFAVARPATHAGQGAGTLANNGSLSRDMNTIIRRAAGRG